jgi:hypothetical protein
VVADLCELQASLVYIVSSRKARATQRVPVSQNQAKQQQKLNKKAQGAGVGVGVGGDSRDGSDSKGTCPTYPETYAQYPVLI